MHRNLCKYKYMQGNLLIIDLIIIADLIRADLIKVLKRCVPFVTMITKVF